MLAEDDSLGLSLVCGLETRLAGLNREIRFIARTLARLRHRHHAALVFSSKQLPLASRKQLSLDLDLGPVLQQQGAAMLKRLFLTPKKERHADEESAPTTPVDEHPPQASTSSLPLPAVLERRHTSGHPASLTPGNAGSPIKPRPLSAGQQMRPDPITPTKRSQSWHSGGNLDTVTLIVDEQSQAVFEIPRKYLEALAAAQQAKLMAIKPNRDSDASIITTGIYLPQISVANFSDFVAWTHTGRIIQHSHNGIQYHIEHQARRLLSALALGCELASVPYQRAVLTELHALGPLLDWPEDLVNGIFAATSTCPGASTPPSTPMFAQAQHPARKLIVAIVGAKTMGAGQRKVRQGGRVDLPRDADRAESGRIASTTFWKMYDGFCAQRGPECRYPDDLDEYLDEL